MTLVKKRKLRWFGHVSRCSGLAKTILQGTMKKKEKEVDRRRGGKTISTRAPLSGAIYACRGFLYERKYHTIRA